uniref:Uncharacterized protein n=1 Tax=Octopus bimaculoides TaxID=37653 RepID=A0A0L8GWX4_OCTBM
MHTYPLLHFHLLQNLIPLPLPHSTRNKFYIPIHSLLPLQEGPSPSNVLLLPCEGVLTNCCELSPPPN